MQGRVLEDRDQAGPVLRRGGLAHQGLGDRGDDLESHGGVGVQRRRQGELVVAAVDQTDVVHVEGVGGDDAARGLPGVQQALLEGGDEGAEDVARAEVHPDGALVRGRAHLRDVEARQGDAGLFPGGGVLQGFEGDLHLPWLLSMPSQTPRR